MKEYPDCIMINTWVCNLYDGICDECPVRCDNCMTMDCCTRKGDCIHEKHIKHFIRNRYRT